MTNLEQLWTDLELTPSQRLQMTNELIALDNKLEYMKPPQDSSFDFYIGFMEARRLALRAIKGLD